MIIFETIRWRNFLSTGNIFTEIKLDDTPNALIVGENGSGKSTLLDALCFALFGKPFRKINKNQLVNSVNEKATHVEIEFRTGNKKYKIIRGIKPNIFEIYCNDVCLNQDSASKDYQEHLEKFILKMNFKTFCQIVILGSASFTPFMQLSASERRGVIEDLLDIQIFSVMSNIVKQRLQINRENLEKNRIELAGKEEKKSFIEKTISSLRSNNEQKLKNLETQYQENRQNIEEIEKEIERLERSREKTLRDTMSSNVLKTRHGKLISIKSQIETNFKRSEKEITFYTTKDSCPTCRQSIDENFKIEETKKLNKKIAEFTDGLSKVEDEINKCLQNISEIDKLLSKAENIRNEITSRKTKLTTLISVVNDLEDEIDKIKNSDTLTINNLNELEETERDIQRLIAEKEILIEDKKYIDTSTNLLKDGGIKTKIIKQYLPVINKLINKYLLQMGFFVNFNINESFEESIKSRYRDDFSYQNFSEGEKTRIDLAILFAWRTVAKMRNSANTNLLIFDEIFDGSLDGGGTDEFLKIMWSLVGESNVFVISHKQDQMIDKFRKVYRFEKIKNFSRLVA